MKVSLDAFWWTDGPPSGRNVVRSIVKEWASAFPDDNLDCWSNPAGAEEIRTHFGDTSNVKAFAVRSPQHLMAIQSRVRGVAYDVSLDQNFTSIRRSAAVRSVFFHDALPQAHPEWFSRPERAYLGLAARMLKHADLVFTSSQSEALRIRNLTSARVGAVHAVGLGLPSDFASANETSPDLPVRPADFLLTVGRLNVRKNVGGLIAALRADNHISRERPLVIVGAPDGLAGGAVPNGESGSDTLFTGFIPDSQLRWLYSNCDAFIFPSLDEGFGLPVLEALHCGARISLSDIPSFREFGPIGSFFDPSDPASISLAVRRALASEKPNPARDPLANWQSVVGKMRSTIGQTLEGKRS